MSNFEHLADWVPTEMERIMESKREKFGPLKTGASPERHFSGLKESMGKLLCALQKPLNTVADYEIVRRKALHVANYGALIAMSTDQFILAETTAIAGTPADPLVPEAKQMESFDVDESSVEVPSPEPLPQDDHTPPEAPVIMDVPPDAPINNPDGNFMNLADLTRRDDSEKAEEAKEVRQERDGIEGEG